MGRDINETDIYSAFREKTMRANCKPDEKVVFVNGCPTVMKKGWLALKLMGLRGAVTGTEAGRETGFEG